MADLYFDADIRPGFALLHAAGHEALTTHEFGQLAASDAEQLSTATRLGRVLVTHNGKDFRTLCQAWRAWRRERGLEALDHAGVIAIPQQTFLRYARAAGLVDVLLRQQVSIGNQVWYFDPKPDRWVRQV